MKATIYNSATGQIRSIIQCPDLQTIALNTPPGHGAISGAHRGETNRVDVTASPHVVVAKVEQPVVIMSSTTIQADGVDAIEITDIADGTLVTLPSGTQVDMLPEFGGLLEVSVDLAGTHEILLGHPLFLPTVVEFTAV